MIGRRAPERPGCELTRGIWNRRVEFFCPFCRRTIVATSLYLNLDALERMGLTQAEWHLALHGERHLLFGEGQCGVCDGTGWTWTEDDEDGPGPERVGRCPNGCPDDDMLDWWRAGLSG